MLENNIFNRKYYIPLQDTKNAIDTYNKILCLSLNNPNTSISIIENNL